MADTEENAEEKYAYHRPITGTIKDVYAMPEFRTLPQQTLLTFNLKGDRESARKLMEEIQRQIDVNDFFAVTLELIS